MNNILETIYDSAKDKMLEISDTGQFENYELLSIEEIKKIHSKS